METEVCDIVAAQRSLCGAVLFSSYIAETQKYMFNFFKILYDEVSDRVIKTRSLYLFCYDVDVESVEP